MKVRTSEPDVQELDDSLFRITLQQPFYEANNVYLLRGRENILIDSGYIESLFQLSSSLKYLGLSLNKLSIVVYTHNHVDHISGGLLMRRYAQKIKTAGHYGLLKRKDFLFYFHSWIHENERMIKLAFANEEIREEKFRYFRKQWVQFLSRFEADGVKKGDRYIHLDYAIHEGDILEFGDYKLEFIEAPGHNTCHIVPSVNNKKWLFTGDLVINHIPAIYSNLDGDLPAYRQSLLRLLENYQGFHILPAHGEIQNGERKIRSLLKSLDLIEARLMKQVSVSAKGIDALLQENFPQEFSSGMQMLVAIALYESVLRNLMHQGLVDSHLYPNGYEEFFLVS